MVELAELLLIIVMSPAADLTISLTNTGLDENSHGVTLTAYTGTSYSTIVELSAQMVWPLLVPVFSNSEKVSHTFWFANTLCVCPACTQALCITPPQPCTYAS